MKQLIIGGTGLVGSEFTKGVRLSSKECDLKDPEAVKKLLQTYNPTHVIHTAARVGGLGANLSNLGGFYYDNVMINTNIIHECFLQNVEKLVCFLSTCIFPDDVTYPLTEDKIHLGPPHHSNYAYAYAKRMADIQLQSYNDNYGTQYFSVIPTNVYGPNDNYNLENSHVVPALIHKVYLAKQNNEDLVCWGSGTPLREFVFSRDVANITQYLLENYKGIKPIIISNSVQISIKELVQTICEIMDFQNKIIWDTSHPDGQFKKPTDNSYLLQVVPGCTFTPLRDGLEHTIDFFVKNYNYVRK